MPYLDAILTPFLSVAALAYVGLALRVSRMGPHAETNLVGIFLALVACLLAGGAFIHNATVAQLYSIGRTLTFLATGFLPVVFYAIYREFTAGPARTGVLALMSVIPVVTGLLALTNAWHGTLWTVSESGGTLVTSEVTSHPYYRYVFAPFAYTLFAYAGIALLARVPSIAAAHRRTVLMIVISAVIPYSVSFANIIFGIGPSGFPFTASTLALMFPLFAWFSLKLRMHEFSPLAYQMLFNHVRDPIFVVDQEQRIVCANKAAQVLLKADERDLIGRDLCDDFPEARRIFEQARQLDLTQTLRLNSRNIYEVSVSALTGPKGQNLGMVIVCRDVTERRTALSQLADSEHLVRSLIETSSNGILRFARDSDDPRRLYRCVFANRAAEQFAGLERSTLVGLPLQKIGFLEPERLLAHFDTEGGVSTHISFEVAAPGVDGEHWLRIVGEPVGTDFSVTLVDITQRKRNEDKMLADALSDPLTGVLNRRGFEQRAAACLRETTSAGVLYLDLNDFKSINDRFGHQAGDALLKAFGHRLEFCLRPEDVLGRLGGDEFAIVLPDVSEDDVRHIADRLRRTASEAYIIKGKEIRCAASIGIALVPRDGEELWALLSVADHAMYTVKQSGDVDAANDSALDVVDADLQRGQPG